MGRYGYGYGYAPCRTPAVIWSADFSALPLSTTANASELRAALAAMGLTLTRASAATVQTSASTVVTSGIGVDDPRVGDGGYGRGLVLEETRTNRVLDATNLASANWSLGAGATRTAGQSDPAGGTAAYRSTAASAAFGLGELIGTGSDTRVIGSYWVKSSAGSAAAGSNLYRQTDTTRAYDTAAVGTTWERRTIDSGVMAAQSASIVLTDGRDFSGTGGLVAGARDFVVYGAQREAGAFPTELILTTGAAATRAADLLVANDPARMIRSGRLGMECRFVPKGNSADHTGSPYVWWSDAGNNYAYWNATLGKFLVIIGGATAITSDAFSWSAGDVVDLWIEAGGGTSTIKARTNSGATQNLGTDATVRAAITGANLSLMGRGGAVLTSWIQRIRAYAPGRRPAWAA